MTRTQALLLAVLMFLSAVLAWPVVVGLAAPLAAAVAAAVGAWASSLPAWAWWAAFGLAMAFKGSLLSSRRSSCGRRPGHGACAKSSLEPEL